MGGRRGRPIASLQLTLSTTKLAARFGAAHEETCPGSGSIGQRGHGVGPEFLRSITSSEPKSGRRQVMASRMPEFTAEASLYRSHAQYRTANPGFLLSGAYGNRRVATVYPQQGCPWWHMAWCGPLIWICAAACIPSHAFGRQACISCMKGCVYAEGIPWLTFCDDCVGSFC